MKRVFVLAVFFVSCAHTAGDKKVNRTCDPIEVESVIGSDLTKEIRSEIFERNNIAPPKILEKAKKSPAYSKDLRERGVEGKVLLKMKVEKDGSVSEVRFVSGPEELKDCSIEAARLWKYEPAKCGGVPVVVWQKQTFVYVLEEELPSYY